MSKTALQNLRNVMAFSLLDDKLDEGEKKLIESLRESLGVSESDFLELCAEVRKDRKSLSLPKNDSEALDTVSLLVEAASADGVVTGSEQRLLAKIARRLNVSDAELSHLMQTSQDARAHEISRPIDEIYEQFESWDQPMRKQKFDALGAVGRAAVVPLLRVFESYRRPVGSKTAVEMKIMVVAQIGRLADDRAAYYLAQHLALGDMEDEITSSELRFAAAEALGLCTGNVFSADTAGLEAARAWWTTSGSRLHGSLAF